MASDAPALPVWLRVRDRGVELRVRLAPKASRDQVDGVYGDRLKIRLTAPPVGGKANEALVRFLARRLKRPAASVRIVAGPRDRSKTLLLETDNPSGLAAAMVRALGARPPAGPNRPGRPTRH